MPRKFHYELTRVTYALVALEPTDIDKRLTKDICEGEQRLMIAVLKDAVECFQKYVLARSGREKQLFQEAEEWFLEKDSEEPFSFENICETLQLHPDYIRRGLQVWKEATLNAYSAQCHRSGRPN